MDPKDVEKYICSCHYYGDQPITQKMYICKTCNMDAGAFICDHCSKFCHSGHVLEEVGVFLSVCSCGHGSNNYFCFLQNRVPEMEKIPLDQNRQCTFLRTGRHFIPQDIVLCSTCGMVPGDCMCVPCSVMCHLGHELGHRGHSDSAYCDCGDSSSSFPDCHIIPTNIPPPIPLCYNTYSSFVDEHHLKAPEFKHCQNCDVDVCIVCAEHCHKNHELIDSNSSKCDCASCEVKCPIMASIEPAA